MNQRHPTATCPLSSHLYCVKIFDKLALSHNIAIGQYILRHICDPTLTMQAQHAIRHLIERGSLPKTTVSSTNSIEIVPDPHNDDNVMLRSERDLLARANKAFDTKTSVLWSDLTTNERLLFRQQHERLKLKRLTSGNIYQRGKYGARSRRELLSAIYHASGGLNCFDLFEEYPGAQQHIINLIQEGKVTNIGTTLWATTKKNENVYS